MRGRTLLPLFFLVVIFSCKKENSLDCFKSNGADLAEIRETGPFDAILIKDNLEVTLQSGSEFQVKIEAGSHIIKNVKATVQNGVLVLENNNTCNFVRGYKHKIRARITVPHIRMVTNDAVGILTVGENFIQDTLVVRNENSGDTYVNGTFNELRTSTNGNGDFFIRGRTNTLYVYTDGTNFVHAENLKVNDFAFVHTSAIGDCHVNASGLSAFAYKIASSGNVYFSGTPSLIENWSDAPAKGNLIKE